VIKSQGMSDTHWSQLIQDLRSENIERAVRASEEISETANKTNISDLYSLLEDDSFFIREAAAFPLIRLEGVTALPALFRALSRGIQDGHDNDGMCAALSDLLDQNQPEVLPLLQNMLLDEDENVRANAAWAFGFIAAQVSPAILLDLLDNEHKLEVRLAAIDSLGSFVGYSEVVDKLISLLGEANEQVVIRAVSSLGYLGDKRAIPLVNGLLHKSSNSRVREFAASTIKRLQNP
jgi:HEAT repeat protein